MPASSQPVHESVDPPAGDVSFDDGQVGVYLHLPFCERICPYCDFAVIAANRVTSEMQTRYTRGLLAELALRQRDFEGRTLSSIYLGGGTPSLFAPARLGELIRAVRAAFPPTLDVEDARAEPEITLEVNPSTTESRALAGFRDVGVNRLSIGIQSFDDGLLKRLGRAHRAAVAHETLDAARLAGYSNLSCDLIFAGPGQSERALERDLDALVAWSPEHVSTYELTFEPETPFGRALASGKIEAPDEDRSVRMMSMIEARLERAGLERYEISSYAREGYRSEHNARYWRRQAVLGLGMGAHSTEARRRECPHGGRRANPRALEEWYAAIERGERPGEGETLPDRTAREEAVFLALRQREGLSAAAFAAEFGDPPRVFFSDAIDRAAARGWLEEGGRDEGDLRLTREGRLWADSVALEFVSGADPSRD